MPGLGNGLDEEGRQISVGVTGVAKCKGGDCESALFLYVMTDAFHHHLVEPSLPSQPTTATGQFSHSLLVED